MLGAFLLSFAYQIELQLNKININLIPFGIMGRSIEVTYVGAYISIGEMNETDIRNMFLKTDEGKKYSGFLVDYMNEQIELSNTDCNTVFCPSDDDAQIYNEITAENIKDTKDFVERRYSDVIKFLTKTFGKADVIVGVFDYSDEIA